MYYAVISGTRVLEVASTEAASLEGMQRYANLGYGPLRRIATTADAFARFSAGDELSTDIEVNDGRYRVVIV